MLWSNVILSEVMSGAYFRLFVSVFHKGTTLKLNLFFFFFFLAILYQNPKGLVSGFVVMTVPKKIMIVNPLSCPKYY